MNFEDETSGVLAAGLMGAAFSAPFAAMGARTAKRTADTAFKELEALQVLRAVHEGAELTPQQGETLRKVMQVREAAQHFEAGRGSADSVEQALRDLHGPQEPADRWLARYHAQLQEDVRQIIATDYPNAGGRATGMAPPSAAQVARMDAAVERETTVNFPGSVEEANAKNPPIEGAMWSAFRTTLDERAQLRKALDLGQMAADQQAAKRAEREAAFQAAEGTQQASKAADQERMINVRELQRVAEGDKPKAFVGRVVSWADEAGSTAEGRAVAVDAAGVLQVETSTGVRSVPAAALDQYTGPAIFGMQSVGSAQVAGTVLESIASQRTALAELTIPGTSIKVPARFDYYAVLNGSPVKRVRELAYKLIKDPIQNDAFEAQGWTASEWKSQVLRTVKDRFHVEAGEAFREAAQVQQVPFWRIPAFARDFYAQVSAVTRGDESGLVGNPLAPFLKRASEAQATAYRKLLEEAKRAGVKGAEDVKPDDAYVNRMWHHGRIREAFAKHGEAAVYRMVADAIVDKPGVLERFRRSPGAAGMDDAAILLHKAERFIGAVRALEFSQALQDIHLAGRDMGTLRNELELLQVPPDRIDDLVDLMFQVRPQEADAGRAGSLKFRFGLDETASAQTPAGTLKLTDLFENDARVLMDSYAQSMAGHIGLAKAGIPSQAAWQAELKRVADEAAADAGIDGARVRKDVALLEDIHKNLLGRPMSSEVFSYTNRSVAAFRGYTRAVMLPQLGIASAIEMNKAVAVLGFRTFLQQLPTLRSLLQGIRQGYVPDEGLARDIMLMTGFGQERAASYLRAQEIENGFMGQSLTLAETGAAGVSHAVNVLSGNASFTPLSKQLSGMMAVQHMADVARGRKPLADTLRERWVAQGIGADELDDVLSDLRRFSTEDRGTVQQVRYEDWLSQSPGTYERFQLFLSRQVRDVIQDQDLGETMPFMHTTLGKVFAELKTFTLVGHAKNFLKNLHYADTTALQVWTIGFLGECLAYMTQTAINYPDELEERLDPERIATAAFFRMSSLGTASLLAETGYSILSGGDSLVRPGTTANTDNRSFLNTPSLTVAGRLLQAPATIGGAVLGTGTTTQREFRDLWSLVPGANLYGLRAVGGWFAESLPKSEPAAQ